MTTTLERPAIREPRPVRAAGLLDTVSGGHGLLRVQGGHPSPGDIQVSPALIRRYGLRKGDAVEGSCERPRVLATVDQRPPAAVPGRPRPLPQPHPGPPHRAAAAGDGKGGPAPRIVDLVSPVGKGQRGLSSHRPGPARRSCSSSSPPPSPPTTPSAT
ncbi:Transcription termination factor Rho OS=Streptomyces cyaneofuscatus OX=66883 GN=rho PE=3 SV=1 [Streptomyces cyaneofuscatus]